MCILEDQHVKGYAAPEPKAPFDQARVFITARSASSSWAWG
jgi:hypothetical protein